MMTRRDDHVNTADLSPTLTVPEAAALLGLGRGTAYDLAKRGALPGARRLGGRVIVYRPALMAWLEGREGEASAPPCLEEPVVPAFNEREIRQVLRVLAGGAR